MTHSGPWREGSPEGLREEIATSARHSFSRLGVRNGVVDVHLWADQVEVAALLLQRYGDRVAIQVGHFPYPEIGTGTVISPHHEESAVLPELPEEVFLSLAEDLKVRSGSHIHSALKVQNESAAELVAGKLIPPVADPSSGRVVGGYEGAITMEMRRYVVAPEANSTVPILIGTASSQAELGWAIPAGRWAIRVVLQLAERRLQRLLPIEILPRFHRQ